MLHRSVHCRRQITRADCIVADHCVHAVSRCGGHRQRGRRDRRLRHQCQPCLHHVLTSVKLTELRGNTLAKQCADETLQYSSLKQRRLGLCLRHVLGFSAATVRFN